MRPGLRPPRLELMAAWAGDHVPDLGLTAKHPPADADRPLREDELAEALAGLRSAPAFRAALERIAAFALGEPAWCGVELRVRPDAPCRRFVVGRTGPVARRWAVVSCWLGDGEPRVLLDVYEASP